MTQSLTNQTDTLLQELIKEVRRGNNRPDGHFTNRIFAMVVMTVGTILFCNTWDLVHGRETIINDALGTDFSSPIKEGDKFSGYAVTSEYGEQREGYTHKGIDIAMPVGTPMYFPFTKGSVKCGKDAGGWGLYATVTSSNLTDPVLLVGHLSNCAGGEYSKRTIFAASGNSGKSTGPHLHLEQRIDGELVPPQKGWAWMLITGNYVAVEGGQLTADSLRPLVEDIASDYPEVTPELILAIADRESNLGNALDKNGLGDNGNGCGIIQVDKRYHPDFVRSVNCATDHEDIIRYGIEKVLIPAIEDVGLECGLAAYNAGLGDVKKAIANGTDCNSVTTGDDYGRDVLSRVKRF